MITLFFAESAFFVVQLMQKIKFLTYLPPTKMLKMCYTFKLKATKFGRKSIYRKKVNEKKLRGGGGGIFDPTLPPPPCVIFSH